MAISCVTFDCYGTLIDWERGVMENAPLSRAAGRLTPAEFFGRFERTQRALVAQAWRPYREVMRQTAFIVLGGLGLVAFPAELDAFADSMGRWPAFDDAGRALAALKGRVRLGILSNVDDATLARSEALLGTAMDFNVTAEQVKSYKPAPAHFAEGARRAGVPAGEILHVAFGFEYDIGPARAAGMRTCWVNRGDARKPEGAVPDHVLRDLDALPALVLGAAATKA